MRPTLRIPTHGAGHAAGMKLHRGHPTHDKLYQFILINMRMYHRVFSLLSVSLFALSCLASPSFGQSDKCDSDVEDGVKINISQSYKTGLPPYVRALRIVVKQKDFNRDFMTRLARTLRQRFCADDEISVMIFDDKSVARTMDEGQFLMGRIKVSEMRGLYVFTTRGNYEEIEYSTKRGNPYNEVRIRLSPE